MTFLLPRTARVSRRLVACVQMRHMSRDVGQPTHFSHPELLATGELLPGMHREEFAERRSNLMRGIAETHSGMTEDKHLVIIPGAHIKYMSENIPYRFHQNTDFLYLTGCLEPDAVLLLETTNRQALPEHKAVLYVRTRDPHKEMWDGPRPGPDGALELTGVDEAYTLSNLEQHLESKYSAEGYIVWYGTQNVVHPEHNEQIIKGLTSSPESRVTSVHNPSTLIAKQRLIKSPSELALMRKAGEITSEAFRTVLGATRPGVNEGQLESVFEHSVKMAGAQWMSYPPVVAGGTSANCLHYIANNRVLKSGELVLMDAGCEYYGYVSDVTRTWPVSGEFSAAQKELYEVVRMVKEECTQLCRKGVTLSYLHSVAVDLLAGQMKAVGILSDRISTSKLVQIINELYPHHVGHYLGMDTHDTLSVDRNTELVPGMVVTIEPGLYIPALYANGALTNGFKELQGTGIRLEDDVLITEQGPEILNKNCPDSVEEVTKLIAQGSS
ncbi:xaa-Pro aminopeptidase 3-like [Halichondria panicea]|uniref:xaa-Pro aminopeptidase 3-like n=1 Tax=Halichondria panicea TaxID=6063 RepID=UPI00312B38C4